ncbi:MAG: hypothetical protein GEU89_11050 [Kiloniellaceae bacterium]|nr:hypothetical protein [Kiloniellaceae bacterium]
MDNRLCKERRRDRPPEAGTESGGACGLRPHCLESLWIRLKVGDRLRPRDAVALRRLGLPPFDRSSVYVYEVDFRGYVIAVGLPGERQRLDAAVLLAAFEARFGVPASFAPSLRAAS